MLSLFCLFLTACGLSFTLGFIWKNSALTKERKAVVNAELKMLDAQGYTIRLAEENRKLKNLLAEAKREAAWL